jgi:hypothetical protein
MQTFGAMGMTKELPLQLMAAKLRTMRIYDGPTEVHKWVVARNLLGVETMKTNIGEIAVARDGHVAVLRSTGRRNNHVSVDLMRDLADALDDVDARSTCAPAC